jgi:hypothetical protein
MNAIANLKSTHWRVLFKLLISSGMQSLNIFQVGEGFFLNLQVSVEFENLKII